MKLLILILALNFYVTASAKNNFTCHLFLDDTATYDSGLSVTENFVAYLKNLYENKVIDLSGLITLCDELEADKTVLTSPLAEGTTVSNIHKDNLAAYLTHPELDRKELVERLNSFNSEMLKTKKQRQDSEDNTKVTAQRIQLHKIEKGSYTKKEATSSSSTETIITLTHSFLMMDTHVNQYTWAKVFQANPSEGVKLNTDPPPIVVDIDGVPVAMHPNRPVTNINWWSAIVFANELSKLEGLKPVYIIEHIPFKKSTSAAKGNLVPEDSVRTPIMKIKINSSSGSIYDTEGYRLPTMAEQEFVRTGRGSVDNCQYFPGIDRSNFNDYAWYQENTPQSRTQDVAEKRPIMIDGKGFYDLFGNVSEWSYGIGTVDNPIDPSGHSKNVVTNDPNNLGHKKSIQGICGLSYDTRLGAFKGPHYFGLTDINYSSGTRGLRLVRSLPK